LNGNSGWHGRMSLWYQIELKFVTMGLWIMYQ
jgi:hypothetical protein